MSEEKPGNNRHFYKLINLRISGIIGFRSRPCTRCQKQNNKNRRPRVWHHKLFFNVFCSSVLASIASPGQMLRNRRNHIFDKFCCHIFRRIPLLWSTSRQYMKIVKYFIPVKIRKKPTPKFQLKFQWIVQWTIAELIWIWLIQFNSELKPPLNRDSDSIQFLQTSIFFWPLESWFPKFREFNFNSVQNDWLSRTAVQFSVCIIARVEQ